MKRKLKLEEPQSTGVELTMDNAIPPLAIDHGPSKTQLLLAALEDVAGRLLEIRTDHEEVEAAQWVLDAVREAQQTLAETRPLTEDELDGARDAVALALLGDPRNKSTQAGWS